MPLQVSDEKMLADLRDLIKTRGRASDSAEVDRAAVAVFDAVRRMQKNLRKKWEEAEPGPEGKRELEGKIEGQFLWTFACDTIRVLAL